MQSTIEYRKIKMAQQTILILRGSANDIKLQSHGQPIAPSAEMQHLHLLVGTWNTEGETHANADAPAVKVTGVDTYEWLAGKFFLVHRANGHMGNEELNSIEFIGYDASSQMYACYSFVGVPSRNENRRGNSDLFQANLRDHTWTIEGKSSRFTGVFANTGNTLTGQWEQSSDGVNWLPWMDIKLTKIL
jgi:Protein of unknown function (DUF1579)